MSSGGTQPEDEPRPEEILEALREAIINNPRLYAMPVEEIARQLILEGHLEQELPLAFIEDALDSGIMLRPEWSALLMSVSSIIVAVNAVLLKGVEGDLDEPKPYERSPEPAPAA